jgi:hypothetical protein
LHNRFAFVAGNDVERSENPHPSISIAAQLPRICVGEAPNRRRADPNFPSIFNARADFTGHIARLGVNYRF